MKEMALIGQITVELAFILGKCLMANELKVFIHIHIRCYIKMLTSNRKQDAKGVHWAPYTIQKCCSI